ncbi:MAG: D-alanyl-D-alanine carboxypeptidase, partial [Actinomycetota bacterium]
MTDGPAGGRYPLMGASPARRRSRGGPGAFLVLGVIAVVPAIALLVLQRWAGDQIPADDAAPLPSTTIVAPPPPADPLANEFATLRRLPEPVSLGLNIDRFRTEVAGLAVELNDRSCLAVSVDGVDAGGHNRDLPVLPASNIKLVVAAVALDLLGAEYRFTTEVVAEAAAVDGVVDGDLALVGGGDPLLSAAWYPTSGLERRPVINATPLEGLADAVVAAGITEVTGDVVGDGSRYDDEFFAPGWGPGVAGLSAGPYDALLVNDARVLGEDQRAADPNAGAAREFARLLAERGVAVAGSSVAGTAPSGGVAVASVDSATLTDVIEEMLTTSDNNTAELMVKEIGLEGRGAGTRVDGLAVIEERLARWDIDTAGLVLGDGSGLSLDSRLTCDALLGVLQRDGATGPIGAGLPVAGENGTLAEFFLGDELAGRLLGKSHGVNAFEIRLEQAHAAPAVAVQLRQRLAGEE